MKRSEQSEQLNTDEENAQPEKTENAQPKENAHVTETQPIEMQHAEENAQPSQTADGNGLKQSRGKLCFKLFYTMLKIGLFTFGGGYAMLALLESEFVSKRRWIDKDEFTNMVAIAESTPGPIAINASTYIGYKVAGFWGSLCATVAVCIPSFIIIYIISLFFNAFLSLTYVAYAFRGIQVCVVYMIISSGIKMFKGMRKKPLDIILLAATVVVMITFSVLAIDFSAVFYILIGGFVGLFVYFLGRIRQREREKKQ